MKAVIMAGGKGTRLRPLTWHLPKPMVPLLDRPCMEYSIDLLKRHGITEIAVTVQYLPHVIKNHFGDGSDYGVKLHFFEETTPLGTAGSVKNAEDFLDETFLVISGDALTDFNLSKAIAYHKEKQAIATLVLTKVDVPIEYGVVMTDDDGKIIRFLEKPSWSEVFSDTVNTGIYILEPEVLKLFEKDQEFDFSKNLFPLLMKNKLPLYGYTAEGYWSDIGNLNQYRQTQFDMLNGAVDIELKGKEFAPGVRVGESVRIHPDANVKGPAFIGDGTVVEAGAQISPNTVVGRFNHIEEGAVIERSVVWNGNHIGKSASLEGATLCSGIRIGTAASVLQNAVVGEKSEIGDKAIVKPGVKIWPKKTVNEGTVLQSSLIWSDTCSNLFGSNGISGVLNRELTPEFLAQIAAAYGSCLGVGSIASVSSDGSHYSEIIKYSVISGLLSVGVRVCDIGTTLAPVARYHCRYSSSDGAIHIRLASTGSKTVQLQFFDREGLPIDKGMERKIENAFMQEDFARPDLNDLAFVVNSEKLDDLYVSEILSRMDRKAIQSRSFRVVCTGESMNSVLIMRKLLEKLGCQVIMVMNSKTALSDIVTSTCADLGVHLNHSGESVQLITNEGYTLTEAEVGVLQALINVQTQSMIGIPVNAPSVIEKISASNGKSSIRTKVGQRPLLEVNRTSPLQMYYDGFYTVVSLLHYLVHTENALHSVVQQMPEFHLAETLVNCPIEAKGRVMRRLMEEVKGKRLELIDGIKIVTDDGWALILPDSKKAQFKIVAEGRSRDKVSQLTKEYTDLIAACLEE
jgi:mannose-1-phosphate guanylyltransferase / phosphomannomutase